MELQYVQIGSGSIGGGGSGGRIALYFTDNTFTGLFTAYGGSSSYEPGAAGTVYQESKVMTPRFRSLMVDNNGQTIREVGPPRNDKFQVFLQKHHLKMFFMKKK